MKIVLCGKSYIACNVLMYIRDVIALSNRDIELIAVPVKGDKGIESWEPSFKRLAQNLNIQIADNYADVAYTPEDLLLSVQYDKIIKPDVLAGARAYNLHFSNLPRYRGCHPSVWPIRNGESEVGVTLHVLTAGIDDGDIIGQSIFPLSSFMNSYDLYKLYNAYGYELVKVHLVDLIDNNLTPEPQNEDLATYYNRTSVDYGATDIDDFNIDAKHLVNYIKSLSFEPYQYARYKGRNILDCDYIIERLESPQVFETGDEVVTDEFHVVVQCKIGLVRLRFK